MQGIKYHSPKRHKKSLKHARLLVLQRFYFLQTVKDGSISHLKFHVYSIIYLIHHQFTTFGHFESLTKYNTQLL